MLCRKCHQDVPDGLYCCRCGTCQEQKRTARKRGNGQGSVYKLPNGKYKAIVTVGYYVDDSGKSHRKTRSEVFEKKKDAIMALPGLKESKRDNQKAVVTYKGLYDKWLPTHRAGKSTIDCYKAAMKHFEPVWYLPMSDIDIDDLQECLDNCGHGKRTQQNMKAVCGLIYKYGIPRNSTPNNLNLAQFLVVGGDGATHRESFSAEQIEKIKNAVGTVEYADYVYCMIYLGFRPSEFLALDISCYDKERKCFVGGGKTEAGTNRVVTISPKIAQIVESIIGDRTSGPVFCDKNWNQITLRDFSDNFFYPVLESAGIENPMVEISGGIKRHKYTPHSCRHTFATLMKSIDAPSKDKQELIGHASETMLKYYQDVSLDDLRKITDLI